MTTTENLRQELDFQTAIAAAGKMLVTGHPDMDKLLASIGSAARCCRAYLFRRSDDLHYMNNAHEWCAEGVESFQHEMQNLPLDFFPWWVSQLRTQDEILIEDVADMPPDAIAEQEIVLEQGVRSLVVVPIFAPREGDNLVGFMGFDDTTTCRKWARRDIETLKTIGQMIAIHWDRERLMDSQKQMIDKLHKNQAHLMQAQRLAGSSNWGFCIESGSVYLPEQHWQNLGFPDGDCMQTGELTLKQYLSYVHPDDRKTLTDIVRRFRQGVHGIDPYDYRVMNHNVVRHVRGRVELTQGEINKKKCLIGTTQDITGQKTLEMQLLQSQKLEAIGSLARGVAHDFNNILSIILGQLELGRHIDADPDMLTEVLDTASDAAQRGAGLVKQILTFSGRRSATGERGVSDVQRQLEDHVSMLQHSFPKTIQIMLETTDDDALAAIVPEQLDQILLNLSMNARDAMADQAQGRLSFYLSAISATTKNLDATGWVCLEISDTGSGIPEHVQPRVFEPFYSTKPQGKGSGLGLATTYGLIQQCGGMIDFQSNVGAGTTFRILLPMAARGAVVQVPAVPEADPQELSLPKLCGGKVLLVEDEPAIRKMLVKQFSRLGLDIVEAEDGYQGMAMLDQFGSDICMVITDLGLPGMSGADMICEIRGRDEELPIIVASGYMADAEGRQIWHRWDHIYAIAKPYRFEQMRDLVMDALQAGKQARDINNNVA